MSFRLILLVMLTMHTNAQGKDLLADIKQYRREKPGVARVDLTPIVLRYIKLNTDSSAALSALQSIGFTHTLAKGLMRLEQYSKCDAVFIAKYDLRKRFSFGTGDVVNIILCVDNNAVKTATGYVAYLAP